MQHAGEPLSSISAMQYTDLALCFTSKEANMTPEELNRTIEFIIQSQARLAAAQEQDRIDRLESEKARLESEKARLQSEKEFKSFDLRLAGLFEIQVRLLESHTRRLDEYEKENRAAQQRHEETHQQMREEFWTFMQETRDWQQAFQTDAQKKHEESMQRFDRILARLTDR
jgi:hypothetical protein